MTRMVGAIESLAPIRVVAFIRAGTASVMPGGAWSAGAMLSYSAERIYMAPGTVMGAAAVVTSGEVTERVEEKYISAFRSKMKAVAEANGHNGAIAAAMVDEDLEVRRAVVDGEIQYLSAEEIKDLEETGGCQAMPRK